ncbi:hypothetical protein [Kutzneria kofuensis]|uniref:Uncharacterized protein n=1 Tax=Kutzneria kofuensis TaxID=103725 RepID=A0A7W9KKY8_9PSEU|nr:hypothetical protein [Kutzneria kofuensis]MBB5894493.1 hypothetical protein [Kutzneria kofuensis]
MRTNKEIADEADINVAKAEAEDLGDALNTGDRSGAVINEIRAKDSSGNHDFRNAIENSYGLTGVNDSVKKITGADFDYPEHGRPRLKAAPKFVARGVGALNVLSFGSDVVNQGWKEATFNLVDPTGVGHQYLEMLQQCDNGGCIA